MFGMSMLDLTAPGALAQLSRQIKDEIDMYCSDFYDDGPRSHLGASEIGHSCARYLCYKFRWADHKKHSGQQQRLFQHGHHDEARSKSYLVGIGFDVREFDDAHKDDTELDKGKRQIRISACKGHFGGSVDGVGYREDVGNVLIEYKTMGVGKDGKGKKFKELQEKGVKLCKPVHYAQMSMYGVKLGLEYAIYITTLKNDDNLHVEFVKLDKFLGESLERKAEMIIFAETTPSGISMSPAYFECNYCDLCDVCHNGKPTLKNCRSCKNSFPVDNAEWVCYKWNAIIPKEHIKDGCPEWTSFF